MAWESVEWSLALDFCSTGKLITGNKNLLKVSIRQKKKSFVCPPLPLNKINKAFVKFPQAGYIMQAILF